jgi:hypothetical protein
MNSTTLHITVTAGAPVPYIKGSFRTVWDYMQDGDSFVVPDQKVRKAAIQAGIRRGFLVTSAAEGDTGTFRVWLVSKTQGKGCIKIQRACYATGLKQYQRNSK